MRYRTLSAVLLLASLAVAPRALADTSPEDRAAADALYEESAKLVKENKWPEACARLEASEKLDPAIGTLMRLGSCYEHIGRTASAWTTYNEVLGLAKANDKRAMEAALDAKRLEPLLARLLLDVAPENRAAAVEVRRDGTLISAGAWGAAVPIDPGAHVIEATAPGKAPWKTTITVEAKAGVTTITVPVLQNVSSTPDAAVPAATVPDAAVPFWGPQRIAGVVMGAVGLVGLGVGAGFTAEMASKNNASLAYCPTDPAHCYAPGVNLRNQAFDASYVATGTFIAGAALVGAGLVVFLTAPANAPKKPDPAIGGARVQPIVGPGLVGAGLQAAW
jgi:hypothetical protein